MFQLLHKTGDFVVIDKSPGISVHKDQDESGLAMLLSEELGADIFPVHRLDKVTSGLMVFATHSEAAAQLSEQFRSRDIEKYYLAISDRKPRRKQGLIIGDMEKSRRGSWKLLQSKNNPAITQFFSSSLKPGLRLFLLKPATGKTHQLRVALKSEGAAILGDSLYSESSSDRTYLHAYALAFTINGEQYRFKSMPEQGEQFDEECLRLINDKFAQPETMSWPKVKVVK
ncbi:TIGR01621 family pseudouridine synthase [Neptuniibacter sp.]|uniref:TIGR01621 family pseudouridine synthase n=1 Tax=Neptuniibacter sp. TaxID=1962643 RepID=UPI002623214B|nr:TIGR01621 family pseudouridine synthase [Neptuniibacter sp.]MCP4594894.1 TIGR01621 family pseudouridine synthase [Neptuniibacter sp.]